eukprot:6545794-Karenia_brevis.AAC.1
MEGIMQHTGWKFDEPPVRFHRSCDNGSLQSSLLTKVAQKRYDGMPCHFMDIRSRLPGLANEYIDAALDNGTIDKEKLSQANN